MILKEKITFLLDILTQDKQGGLVQQLMGVCTNHEGTSTASPHLPPGQVHHGRAAWKGLNLPQVQPEPTLAFLESKPFKVCMWLQLQGPNLEPLKGCPVLQPHDTCHPRAHVQGVPERQRCLAWCWLWRQPPKLASREKRAKLSLALVSASDT